MLGELGVVFGVRRGVGLRFGIVESVCGWDGVVGGFVLCIGCVIMIGILWFLGVCGMFDGVEEVKVVVERGFLVCIRVVVGSVCG